MAAQIAADAPEATSLVVTDARRREVYWAQYAGENRVSGPDVIAPAAVSIEGADQKVDVVSVPENLREQLAVEADIFTYVAPRPAGLVAVADLAATPEPLVPLYLRRPDAKEPTPKPKSPAIPDLPKDAHVAEAAEEQR